MAESVEKQLAKILSGKVKQSNGRTIKQNLESAVNYLYKCLDNQILAYYASYSPKVYKRTFDFQDSLYAENFINAKVKGNRIELDVSFKDSMSWHKNFTGEHDSYIPILVNFGWNAPKLALRMGKGIHRFTYYEGFHMVEKAVIQFNAHNPYGVYISPDDVTARWQGREIGYNRYYNAKIW